MFKYTVHALSCALTFVYTFMVFVMLGKFNELDPFSYFNIEHSRVEAVVLTTTSFMIFSVLFLNNYFSTQAMQGGRP